MKVVHIVTRHFGHRYGADANIANWIEWERRNGIEVVLIAGRASPLSGFLGVDVRVVHSLVREIDPVNDLRALLTIRSILDEEQPDVVHTHHSKAGIVGRLAVRRVAGQRSSRIHGRPAPRVVHTVHIASFGPAYGRASRVFLALERLCARRTAEFIAVGEELRRRYLEAGVGHPDHFCVVRSPAAVERFLDTRSWSQQRRLQARDTWNLPRDRKVVVAAGLLEERKRHGMLIDRLRPLLADGRAVLVLAGDGPLHDQLLAQASAAGLSSAVRMVGYVDRLEELVAAADVFVHTARVEGVPQTVLQALAAGVPVVATSVEGLQEIPGNPITVVDVDGEGLAEAVGQVLDGHAPPPVEAASVEPWMAASVERQIAELYGRMGLAPAGEGRGQAEPVSDDNTSALRPG